MEYRNGVFENVLKTISPESLHEMICECAYFKAEKRGFTPGSDLDDWLAAEYEVSNTLFYWYQDIE